MKIDYVLILCAGFGTRMGPIGEVLPKPLWPIFEKSMLKLQIALARRYSPKKIFVNIHHQKDLISNELMGFEDVEILYEPEILGSGGAVHNVLNHLGPNERNSNLLYMVGDAFYLLSQSHLENALKKIDQYRAVLFGMEIPVGDDSYGKLMIQKDLLKGIEKANQLEKYITFSGVGIINLKNLDYEEGNSGFFETVADYKNKKVFIYNPKDCEYWDFGTKERYFLNMFKLLLIRNSRFKDFCIKHEFIKENKIDFSNGNYNCEKGQNIINLMSSSGEFSNQSIIMAGPLRKTQGQGLYYKDLNCHLDLLKSSV